MRNPFHLFLSGLLLLWASFGLSATVIGNETTPHEDSEVTVSSEVAAEPEIEYIQAWINADEPEVVVDVYFANQESKRFCESLASGVEFTENYGDYTVEALYFKTKSGVMSYCNVTKTNQTSL